MLPSRADELYASSGRGDWGTDTMTGRGILAISLTALVVCSGLLAPSGTQAQAPTETVTVFRGARLIRGDGSPPIENAAFVVRGSLFVGVGANRDVAIPTGAITVDLTGKTVMPAL